MNEGLFNFLSGIIGAVVGGVFVLAGTWLTIRSEARRDQQREDKEVQHLLDALGVEIRALWTFHMKRVGEKVEALQEGQPLEFYYPLTQDYFTIYNANAALIGRIKDCELAEAIVVCYNKCKKAVDGFKYNNELIREYRELRDMPSDGTAQHGARVKSKLDELIAFAALIQEDHFELKGYIERMQALLQNES